MSSKIDVTGRLSVYLRGGAVIALARGRAQISIGNSGRVEEMQISDGQVDLVWIDTAEVVAVVKEGETRDTRFSR
ncbi:MAG: hypothetical protein JWM27_2627 [Gemmatimonadetes bacterium]|nr:hypothetical protein [Gemmatimonadota bacterium]